MIYIVCPNFNISGGPEASHQLSYYLTKNNIENRIAYFGKRLKDPVPDNYKKYISKYVWLSKKLDKPNNHIIFSEVDVYWMRFFKKAKKSVWWLSVDNFVVEKPKISFSSKALNFMSGVKNLDFLKIKNSLLENYKFSFSSAENHFFASYYAESFLKENHCKNPIEMIEPIGLDFINDFNDVILKSERRTNEILYNPTKDKVVVPKLIEIFPDLNFRAIKNLSHKEIAQLFKKNKLYVDFGHFPGPERLPKEAVAMGCCVITSRKGAANFYGDVPIPDEFKFSENAKLDDIYNKIKECLENYDGVIQKFEAYRQRVYNLENNFEKQIVKIFGK